MTQGSIIKRGKNSYRLKFELTRDHGKRDTQLVTFRGTKKEAKTELKRLTLQVDDGAYVRPSKDILADYLAQWIDDAEALRLSAKTAERYRQLIAHQIIPHLGGIVLTRLRPAHIKTWHATLIKQGGAGGEPLAARTVGHAHRVLHRALAEACTLEMIARNPATAVKPPKVEADEIAILTQNQIADVLRKIEGKSLAPLIALAIFTGMRRGELLAIRWSDVDLDAANVRVERSLEQTGSGLHFKAPKTKSGRRKISLPGYAVAVLRKHRKGQLEFRMKIGAGRLPDDALVFCNMDGAPYSPRAVSKSWTRLVKAHDLPKVTLHSLRHSHASALISAGMDAVTVCRRLGHANPSITLSVYSHMFQNSDDRAAEILDDLLPMPMAE